MPKKPSLRDDSFYCKDCERVFLNPSRSSSETQATIACPSCSSQAQLERLPDGRFRIVRSDNIIPSPKPLVDNRVVMGLFYLGALAVIALLFAAIAHLVGIYLCPIVFGASLAALVVIGGIQLAHDGHLNKNFVDLMGIFFKGLPALLGAKVAEGKAVAPGGSPSVGRSPSAAV